MKISDLPTEGAFTEAQMTEMFRDYEGDAFEAGKFDVIVEGWKDATETPSECIARLNREVLDLARRVREAHGPALPTEDGWYESEQYPIADGYSPYRLWSGKWGDADLLPRSKEYMLNRMPLHRLGRIDTKESGQVIAPVPRRSFS